MNLQGAKKRANRTSIIKPFCGERKGGAGSEVGGHISSFLEGKGMRGEAQ